MENLEIQPTNDTPKVHCDVQGEILMSGRSLPENPIKLYEPLFNWAQQFEKESILLNFKLEYFNTASSKQIFNLIKIFVENPKVKDVLVKWHYEEGDYDSKETGEHFSHLFKIPFEFIEYAESGL
jgi:SiaC family regulatory phosphoprotein